MKINCMRFLCVFLPLFSTHGLAMDARWISGFGQGNFEYFVDNMGYRLIISCPTQDGSSEAFSSVQLYKIQGHFEINKFVLTVNGVSFDGPFEASNRVGTDNFIALLDRVRKANVIAKVGKEVVTFPRSNAAKVIPVYGKGFDCNLF